MQLLIAKGGQEGVLGDCFLLFPGWAGGRSLLIRLQGGDSVGSAPDMLCALLCTVVHCARMHCTAQDCSVLYCTALQQSALLNPAL